MTIQKELKDVYHALNLSFSSCKALATDYTASMSSMQNGLAGLLKHDVWYLPDQNHRVQIQLKNFILFIQYI